VSRRGEQPLPPIAVRAIAGCSLLLLLFVPASVAVAGWAWDWRWLLTGLVSGVIGLLIGWLLTQEAGR
jgi:hypothetical protein